MTTMALRAAMAGVAVMGLAAAGLAAAPPAAAQPNQSVLASSAKSAQMQAAKRSCRGVPGVTRSGNKIIFSGFVHCTPNIHGGNLFLLAYSGNKQVQHFRKRSVASCFNVYQRCYANVLRLPNPRGKQTFCSVLDGRIGWTSMGNIRVQAKYCRRL